MKRWVGVVLLWVGAGVSVAVGQARLGPYVVDSNGLKVGHLYNGDATVLLFVNGEPATIAADRAGFLFTPGGQYYTVAGCAGTPYLDMDPHPPNSFFADAVFTTDGVFRYASMAAASPLMYASAKNIHGDGSLSACIEVDPPAGPINLAPMLTAPASFVPPFHVVDTLPVSPPPGTATFNDVPTTDPAFKFIEALYNSGITSGCQTSPPLYCPDNTITRREMAVFLAVALGL
jgi:hypothetical protein